jgi:hypothetical protein
MKLRITSIPNFITFLGKLKAVDKSVILEIMPDKVFSKVHTADKSVMKYASIEMDNVFETDFDWSSIKYDRINIGLVNVTVLMSAFKHFRPEEEVYLEVDIATVDDSCVATEIRLVSPALTIKLRCSDLTLLSYVEDKILDIVHSKESPIATFKLYQSDFTTIVSLCGMENDASEILTFSISKSRVHAVGNSFDYKINVGASEIIMSDDNDKVDSAIYKNQLSHMEAELCNAYIHEGRLVLFSEQSSTSIAIGLVEK